MMNSKIIRDVLQDGSTIARITLLRDDSDKMKYCQYWVGDVRLEYGTKPNGDTWGRYFSITDFGNYSYAWFSIGKEPFEHFVQRMAERDADYFMGKLVMGHGEANMFCLEASKQSAREFLDELREDGDLKISERQMFLESLDDVCDESSLDEWYRENLDMNEGYERFVYGYSERCKGYMENVFPLLAEVLASAENESC